MRMSLQIRLARHTLPWRGHWEITACDRMKNRKEEYDQAYQHCLGAHYATITLQRPPDRCGMLRCTHAPINIRLSRPALDTRELTLITPVRDLPYNTLMPLIRQTTPTSAHSPGRN